MKEAAWIYDGKSAFLLRNWRGIAIWLLAPSAKRLPTPSSCSLFPSLPSLSYFEPTKSTLDKVFSLVPREVSPVPSPPHSFLGSRNFSPVLAVQRVRNEGLELRSRKDAPVSTSHMCEARPNLAPVRTSLRCNSGLSTWLVLSAYSSPRNSTCATFITASRVSFPRLMSFLLCLPIQRALPQ